MSKTEIAKSTSAIGRRIRETRKALKLSQIELAAIIGIPNSHLSDIERGSITPTIPTLKKIGDALDRPIEYFVRRDDESGRSLGLVISRSLIGEQAAAKFTELVSEKTGGELKIHIYQNAIPQTVYQIVEGVAEGSVHIFLDDMLSFEHYARLSGIVSLPFFFQDRAQYQRFLESSYFYEHIWEQLLDHGIRILNHDTGWEAGSFECLFSNRPIFTPDELAGLRFRSYASEIADALRVELGAKPVRVLWNESPEAMQRDEFDLFLLPSTYLSSLELYKVAQYATFLDCGYTQNLVIAVSEHEYRKLSPVFQQTLQETVQEMGMHFREMMAEDTEATLKEMTETYNVPLIRPNLGVWRERISEAIRNVGIADGVLTPELYEQLTTL